MGKFKTVSTQLMDWFNARADVNEVNFGDMSQVDTSTRTEFPLVHIIPINSTYTNNISTFNYQIYCLTKFQTGDNVIDVLDLTNQILSEFVAAASNSNLFGQISNVLATPTAETMYDKFKNRLYGYSLTFQLQTPTDLPPC